MAKSRAKGRRQAAAGSKSRQVAIEALVRIDEGGAYANLVLPKLLSRSGLSDSDRHFVTELVYGSTRMRRACDHLVDRYLLTEVEPRVRAGLRIGAYQIAFLRTPDHAAVAATVGAVGGRARSLVNAVLRRVADAPVTYPDLATELSYPDWIVERLQTDLGPDRALAALRAMNEPAEVTVRADGYAQDPASQFVVEAVGAGPGEIVIDLCAAPGGKATALAATEATVIAGDVRANRIGLVAKAAERTGTTVRPVLADGTHPPVRPGTADRVLVDAPCSGLGSLRRRPDARWRIDPAAPERLARLQTELVLAGLDLLRPGGLLTYSVCTLTTAESSDVLSTVLDRCPAASVVESLGSPWLSSGGVATLLPAGTDGMMLFTLRRS